MGKLDGKVAFITGAARGQGRAAALAMAAEGADIACFDVCQNLETVQYDLSTRDDLEKTVADIKALGRRAIGLVGDVRNFDQMKAAVDETISTLGQIDILVNNAGIAGLGAAQELPEDEWDSMIDINLKGVWLGCKAVIPHMISRQSGTIISYSSVAGVKGLPFAIHYTCAKWGVIALTKTLAQELAPHKIRVNCIGPGTCDTGMVEGLAEIMGMDHAEAADELSSGHIISKIIPPAATAAAALWLASDDSKFVTGHTLMVDSGWSAT